MLRTLKMWQTGSCYMNQYFERDILKFNLITLSTKLLLLEQLIFGYKFMFTGENGVHDAFMLQLNSCLTWLKALYIVCLDHICNRYQ